MADERIVRTSRLDVHVRTLPGGGRPSAILLHGWPDSARTWDGVAARLAAAGHSTYAPSLRGNGRTRFLDDSAPRDGRLGDLTQDVLELCDALELDRFHLIGHDWGARAGFALAAVAPERLHTLTAISAGWRPASTAAPISARQARLFWYQWLLDTPLGEDLLRREHGELVELIWREWSPNWEFSAEELELALASMQNPDWADVTLGYYRSRWGWQQARPLPVDGVIASATELSAPTLVIHGEADQCVLADSSEGLAPYFPAGHSRVALPGVGHFPQREAPDLVADAILEWLSRAAVAA